MTAQELWDVTEPYRREGGPGTPIAYYPESDPLKLFSANSGKEVDLRDAEAILGWHGLMSLVKNNNYPLLRYEDTEFRVGIDIAGELRESINGPTMLHAIAAAVAAVLEGKYEAEYASNPRNSGVHDLSSIYPPEVSEHIKKDKP